VWEGSAGRKDARAALKNLRHDFIVCVGIYERGEEALFPAPIIVEPMFKEQFFIASMTEDFETLVKVGPCAACRLQ
jgi:hypothetical protein